MGYFTYRNQLTLPCMPWYILSANFVSLEIQFCIIPCDCVFFVCMVFICLHVCQCIVTLNWYYWVYKEVGNTCSSLLWEWEWAHGNLRRIRLKNSLISRFFCSAENCMFQVSVFKSLLVCTSGCSCSVGVLCRETWQIFSLQPHQTNPFLHR